MDFEVGGGDFEEFVIFAVDRGGAGGFNGDGAGSELLGDEDGKGLRAALVPVVDVGEDFVLVGEIVVEDGDEWRAKESSCWEGCVPCIRNRVFLANTSTKVDAGGTGIIGSARYLVVADGGCCLSVEGRIAGGFV